VTIRWHFRIFKDQEGLYYPSQIKTLIVISKETNGHYFPFKLRITSALRVEAYGDAPLLRHLKRPAGWAFKINENYKSHIAADALRDVKEAAMENRIPRYLGLRAAVGGYATSV
jgi:hypothetical protein